MRLQILEKISRELDNGVDTEAKVLYLLVEIRKVREKAQNLTNHKKTILDFYRDWAAHTELTHSDAAQAFLSRFEPYVKAKKNSHEIARDFVKHDPAFFKLEDLKTELTEFLQKNELSTRLTADKNSWYKFVNELLKILKDCNIRPKSRIGSIEELLLDIDSHGNALFKFRLKGRRDCPICKLKWK